MECRVEGKRELKWKKRRRKRKAAIFCTYYLKMTCFCIFNLYCQLVGCCEMQTADSSVLTCIRQMVMQCSA